MSIWTKHLCNLFGKAQSAAPKPGEFKCPLCGDIVPRSELLMHAVADDNRFREGRLITRIKQDHPEWLEADSACPKCVEHYRQIFGTERIEFRTRSDHAE